MGNLIKKILIVEDDKDFLWILKESLSDKEFSVVSAQDGEEGLKMVEKERPDLILLDILLPKMDGVAVAKKLKDRGDKTKIIFLSNLKGKLPVTEGIVAEADYIVKTDLHIDQIVAKVKERLSIK